MIQLIINKCFPCFYNEVAENKEKTINNIDPLTDHEISVYSTEVIEEVNKRIDEYNKYKIENNGVLFKEKINCSEQLKNFIKDLLKETETYDYAEELSRFLDRQVAWTHCVPNKIKKD